jgi:ADP-dependent phosphofructokinase/glucokinase
MARVVLGLGGCLDYEIVWDSAVLEELVVRHGIRPDELGTDVEVVTERDLVRSVLGFVRDGVGGERFVATSAVVEAFAVRFDRRVTVGGTNVRAAVAMSRIGVPSSVHLVSTDPQVRALLPSDVDALCSADADSVDPHLVVQYPAGTAVQVGDEVVRAERPNRLIYVNDPPNRLMRLSPALGSLLEDAGLFLCSGFNSMQDPDLLSSRLAELRTAMRSMPRTCRVVYEDAGFHVPALSEQVRAALADVVDVHGLNEDELQAYVGREVDLLDAVDLDRALDDLQRVLRAPTLVVHSRYWALAVGERVDDYVDALDGGVLMASTRYLHGDAFTAADHEASRGIRRHAEGSAVAAALERLRPGGVRVVPALVLDTPAPTTIGLGDSFVGGFVAALARRDGLVPQDVA